MLNNKGYTLIETTTVLLIVLLVFFSIFRGLFVDESIAARALQKQGYQDSKIVKKDWLFVGLRGCDAYEAAKITANAINPAKREVEIFVCTGWPFKGATIRTD